MGIDKRNNEHHRTGTDCEYDATTTDFGGEYLTMRCGERATWRIVTASKHGADAIEEMGGWDEYRNYMTNFLMEPDPGADPGQRFYGYTTHIYCEAHAAEFRQFIEDEGMDPNVLEAIVREVPVLNVGDLVKTPYTTEGIVTEKDPGYFYADMSGEWGVLWTVDPMYRGRTTVTGEMDIKLLDPETKEVVREPSGERSIYRKPPASTFHHQSTPGGPVKCRLCQRFTDDWENHLEVCPQSPAVGTLPDGEVFKPTGLNRHGYNAAGMPAGVEPKAADEPKPYLRCQDCGEVFDAIDTALGHDKDVRELMDDDQPHLPVEHGPSTGYDIVTEEEAF
jgi:hypothetical protein